MRTCLCRFGFSLSLGPKGSKRVVPKPIDPGPQGREPMRVDGIDAARAFCVIGDETGFLQHFEMLGYGRPADRHVLRKGSHGQRSGPEPLEHAAARWISQCGECFFVSHNLRSVMSYRVSNGAREKQIAGSK